MRLWLPMIGTGAGLLALSVAVSGQLGPMMRAAAAVTMGAIALAGVAALMRRAGRE